MQHKEKMIFDSWNYIISATSFWCSTQIAKDGGKDGSNFACDTDASMYTTQQKMHASCEYNKFSEKNIMLS